MKLKSLLAGMLLIAGVGASAHDFSATVNGQRLYFEITNKARHTVEVTYCGSITDKRPEGPKGRVEIPARVKHKDVVYQVAAIGQKAFAGSTRLQGIVIPSGVESIGDFAFEGCDSLQSIVFPGNAVTLGQGIFFKCTMIEDVTIGSDWKTIDFTMFRWSNRLTRINIPAKIGQVKGVKKLAALKEITVDPNNAKFASEGGLLYNKNFTTLFACPRAMEGKVAIKEGTATITPGALIDCTAVTELDLPASLTSMSFRETSRMDRLSTVVMRQLNPISTAFADDKGYFLLQIANPNVVIMVPDQTKKEYIAALPAPGEYTEKTGGIPYTVTAAQIPTKKNIKGVKNFDKL